MNTTRINDWLGRWVRSQITLNWLAGVGMLLAGTGILVVTWGITYMVSLFALGAWLGYHHWFHSAAGLFLIPALFWGNARTSRDYLSEYSVTVGTAADTVVNFYIPGVGMGSNINPLAPGTIHAGVKMITDCLYTGPRVVMGGFHMIGRGQRLRQLDREGCAAVLTLLFASHRKLAFQEIVDQVSGLDPARVFPQLHWVDGVIFLAAEPAGLTLSQDLRQTLRGLFERELSV